jgi:hypothetical protein
VRAAEVDGVVGGAHHAVRPDAATRAVRVRDLTISAVGGAGLVLALPGSETAEKGCEAPCAPRQKTP